MKNELSSGNLRLFLDSGAFSGDSQGKPIDLEEYISFIKKHDKNIDLYPVLDVLGSVEETWKNQKIMEDEGLSPMPVYHADEDIKYLYKCLDYDYFCLGGMAGGASQKTRTAFLNKCFQVICDTSDGKPKNKVHGFGLASPSLMVAYPFYSVDTSSWVSYAQYGRILVPQRDVFGIPDYGKTPINIYVTERSPFMEIDGRHFKNLSIKERESVNAYVEEMGFTMGESIKFQVAEGYELQEGECFINKEKSLAERIISLGVCNNNTLRYSYSVAYFNRIAESCPEWPWSWKPSINTFF